MSLVDKFGIFKLINSFYNFYQENKDSFPKPTPQDKPPAKPDNHTTKTPETATKKPFNPLQSSMINTMNSHDNFVKRVLTQSGIKQN